MVSIEELKLGNETLEALKFLLSQITELETAISQINISEIKDANTLTKQQIVTLQDVKAAVESINTEISSRKTDFDEKKQNFDTSLSTFKNDKADFDSKNNTALSNFAFISDNVEKINSTSALLAEAKTILETIKPIEQRTQTVLDTIANSQAKFDELDALKATLLELKRSLENINTNGLINDTSTSTITTYSSVKIDTLTQGLLRETDASENNAGGKIVRRNAAGNIYATNIYINEPTKAEVATIKNSLAADKWRFLIRNSDEGILKSMSIKDFMAGQEVDAYTKQESNSKFLKIGDYGLGGLDNMPVLQNIDDTTTPTGFYRAVENQTSGTFPQPYGGSRHAHVLVERVDANCIKQTITEISSIDTPSVYYRTNKSNDGVWGEWKEIVTGKASAVSSANSIVARDENGDFAGRFISAEHFRLKTPTQNNLFGESSEILFRGGASEDANYVRAVSGIYLLQALLGARGDGIFFQGVNEKKGESGEATFGYVRLPGGVLFQFGISHRMNPGETREQYFPVAFPTHCLCVLVSAHMPIPNDGVMAAQDNAHDNAKFVMQNCDANSSMHIAWMAIGA